MSLLRRVALVAVGLCLFAGCGSTGVQDGAVAGKRVPITARAIAAVMLDHVPVETSRREATYVDENSPAGYVGADFRYHGDGESDGTLVRVTIQRASKAPACREGEHCVTVRRGLQLSWDTEEPEEDPGYVAVAWHHDGELVVALLAGPRITRDPRTMRLGPSVDALTALARDPRLRLRTGPDVVAAGTRVAHWKGGERDPSDLAEVRNNDRTVITGFIFGWGAGWRYVGPSPLKQRFGPDAIGGRVQVSSGFEPVDAGVVDALAAPRAPGWARSGCLAGYRCSTTGQIRFLWRPAEGRDPGDAYLVHVAKSGETVALHVQGPRFPAGRGGALARVGYYYWGTDFFDPEAGLSVGYTTTHEKFAAAMKAK